MSVCIQENDLSHALFVRRHLVGLVFLKDILVFILDNALFHVINARKYLVLWLSPESSAWHIGEWPYACDTCKKCFSVFNTLKNHQRLHNG